MLLGLLYYAFFFLITTFFIALVWDYTKIFLSIWQSSKELAHSNLSNSLVDASKSATDNE